MKRILWILVLSLFWANCAQRAPMVRTPSPINIVPPQPESPPKHSLFTESSPQSRLFADHKAYQVGDVIVVKVLESAQAYNKAQTKTFRQSSAGGGISNFFGINLSKETSLSANTNNSFQGSGETSRQEKLVTTFAAQVIKVFPNGNLLIQGRRDLVINSERRYIIIRGVVRPEDISPNNTVLSTSIANAEVVYTGRGAVSDKQKPGWFIRIFDNIWPF